MNNSLSWLSLLKLYDIQFIDYVKSPVVVAFPRLPIMTLVPSFGVGINCLVNQPEDGEARRNEILWFKLSIQVHDPGLKLNKISQVSEILRFGTKRLTCANPESQVSLLFFIDTSRCTHLNSVLKKNDVAAASYEVKICKLYANNEKK